MGKVFKNRVTSCVGVRKTGTTLIRVSTVMGTLYTKLKSCWKRDSWSLCHGIVGNLMILGKYEKKDYWCNDTVRFLPHEILNPGMMNGYGGALYSLLQLQGTNLPDILSLD